jgi:hypothetical protein
MLVIMPKVPRLRSLLKYLTPSIEYLKKGETDSRKLAVTYLPKNFARALLVEEFLNYFKTTHLFDSRIIQVAIIGGYSQEPEIVVLKELGIKMDITFFGVDSGMEWLDLNKPQSHNSVLSSQKYDLVLCSQVLEHIWNHSQAFSYLKQLLHDHSYLWISCPSSNRPHGLDFFYSAGFTSKYLVNNLELLQMKVVASGSIGTRRLYRAIHTLPTWLSVKGHAFPPLWIFEEHPYDKETLYYRLFFRIRYLLRSIELLCFSSKVTCDVRCATESWVVAKL